MDCPFAPSRTSTCFATSGTKFRVTVRSGHTDRTCSRPCPHPSPQLGASAAERRAGAATQARAGIRDRDPACTACRAIASGRFVSIQEMGDDGDAAVLEEVHEPEAPDEVVAGRQGVVPRRPSRSAERLRRSRRCRRSARGAPRSPARSLWSARTRVRAPRSRDRFRGSESRMTGSRGRIPFG